MEASFPWLLSSSQWRMEVMGYQQSGQVALAIVVAQCWMHSIQKMCQHRATRAASSKGAWQMGLVPSPEVTCGSAQGS